MADKKIPVKIDTGSSLQQLRELKKELRNLSAGTDDFNKKAAQIRDVEDNLEAAKIGAEDFAGALESAPGPIGQIARGFKSLEVNTKSFGNALRATGIGLLVGLIGGLVAAFMNSEKAMKKLEPVMEAFQKILGGIFAAFEPVLDVFIEMVEYVLPAFTTAIGVVYSTIYGLFSIITNAGKGVMTILQGIFNNDLSQIGDGFKEIGNSIGKAVDDGLQAYDRFEKGSEELTEKEKEELAKRQEQEKEAAQKRKEAAEKAAKEEEDRLKAYQDLYSKYLNEEMDLLVKTDQEKLDLDKKRAQAELDALKLTNEERAKLQEQLNAVFQIKQDELDAKEVQRQQEKLDKEENLQMELRKLRASTTDSLVDDTAVELELTNQKYAALIEAAILNNESIVTLELLKQEELDKIKKDGDEKEALRIKANQDKEAADQQASIDRAKQEATEKQNIRLQTLDAIISAAGQETAVAKAAFVAQQLLRLMELKQLAVDTIKKIKLQIAKQKADLAAGVSATASVGTPLNVPLLILYAAQAAAIVSSTISAFSAAKSAADQTAGGGSTSAPATPPIPTGVVARRNQGGFVFGDGGSITDSIPTMLSDGEFVMNAKSAGMFSPMLTAMNNMGNLPNTAIPQALGNQSLVDVMSQNTNNRPIKTYVTAQDMSNQQQFDRTIKSRSLI